MTINETNVHNLVALFNRCEAIKEELENLDSGDAVLTCDLIAACREMAELID